MGSKRGYCLPSQDIRELLGKVILDSPQDDVENRIQTNSFEPTISEECWWVDEGVAARLRGSHESIQEALDEIESGRKRKHKTKDLILQVGHTYIFPLNESLKLPKNMYVKSTPKSSSGRTFADVRAFADKNRAIDLIHPLYSQEKVKIWVMITPRIFNIQVGPGLSFNQLRFFVGQDPKLSQSEISQLHEKEAIAYDYNDGKPKKLPTIFNHADGLLTTLSLQSRDGRNKLKDLKVKPGDCFLLFTREILHFPAEFSGEMKAYSMAALRGPLHFAGFFDNGFYGDAVIELLSEETEEIYLTHGMPIAEFEFYRTSGKPDKIYGDKKSGSNYYGQVGPRMAKYFKQEDMSGIVALKARKVPYPLDLRKKHFYHMRDFFEVY